MSKRSSSRRKHSVHWFRRGLRLSDNPALLRAIRRCETWRCIFILDPWFAGSSNVGTNKWRFLLQCLEDLDSSLRKLNSRLFVVRGQPADVLPTLFKEWETTYLTFEEDPEPFGRVRDQNIIAMCKEMDIVVTKEHSHTLYNLERIIERNNGKAPLTYKRFQSIIEGMDTPAKPVPTLTAQMLGSGSSPIQDDHDEKYGVPSLEELGFDCDNLKPNVWIGGETEALSRLERHLERKAWVASFGRPKMSPQSLLPSQTGLSPYLRFGCLSTRLFYHALTDLYRKIKKCDPPLSLHGQLLWREFFYCASTKNAYFDKMVGNPICVQIPWDRNDEALAKWANAHTGFPWIDAIMTQLREEGWIHHLARHAVACFLTRGDLWVSWEEGMKVFEELLLDADWSVNAGTWLWLSCSSFFQQFFHCYSPVKFGRKADANGDFIRRYLPVLKNFPTRYIHEPWTAPEAVQKSAKCIIGQDYPKPICNHSYVSKMNMERMKQVYQQLAHYSQTGQTGPGIPHDLLDQLPKVPKIISANASIMGPPNPPDQKKKIPMEKFDVDCENFGSTEQDQPELHTPDQLDQKEEHPLPFPQKVDSECENFVHSHTYPGKSEPDSYPAEANQPYIPSNLSIKSHPLVSSSATVPTNLINMPIILPSNSSIIVPNSVTSSLMQQSNSTATHGTVNDSVTDSPGLGYSHTHHTQPHHHQVDNTNAIFSQVGRPEDYNTYLQDNVIVNRKSPQVSRSNQESLPLLSGEMFPLSVPFTHKQTLHMSQHQPPVCSAAIAITSTSIAMSSNQVDLVHSSSNLSLGPATPHADNNNSDGRRCGDEGVVLGVSSSGVESHPNSSLSQIYASAQRARPSGSTAGGGLDRSENYFSSQGMQMLSPPGIMLSQAGLMMSQARMSAGQLYPALSSLSTTPSSTPAASVTTSSGLDLQTYHISRGGSGGGEAAEPNCGGGQHLKAASATPSGQKSVTVGHYSMPRGIIPCSSHGSAPIFSSLPITYNTNSVLNTPAIMSVAPSSAVVTDGSSSAAADSAGHSLTSLAAECSVLQLNQSMANSIPGYEAAYPDDHYTSGQK